jgi:type VI secretion system secreted protein VgrG
MPQVIKGDQPHEPEQQALAEVDQRENAPALNVESQVAALRKGNATCPVCEEQNS